MSRYKKIICPHCGIEYFSNGLVSHIKSKHPNDYINFKKDIDNKKGLKKALEINNDLFQCVECSYKGSKQSVLSHWWRNHTLEGKQHNPNLGFKLNGREIWNKGLTKETDERVLKSSVTLALKIQ